MTYEKKETLIAIKDVGLSFGSKVILRGVNAEIHNISRPDCVQGQVVCFLGPSGIGKTQLSRIIAGLQVPTEGVVELEGKPTGRGKVGMVPQNYQIFDFLTVRENLEVAWKQAGASNKYKRLDTRLPNSFELVKVFGLEDHLQKYPSQLSGGQKQRVSIVRQLLCGHQFIVMDEPFSGLDLVMKRKACELITQTANLHDKNTIIVVTHDVTEGMSIADTVWLMGRQKGVEGAKILEEIDLAQMGLCWSPDIQQDSGFLNLVRDVKQRFLELASN